MRVTEADLRMLARGPNRPPAGEPEGREGELRVFIPCVPVNPLNGSHGHWRKHATQARRQREKAQGYLLTAIARAKWTARWTPETPKRITFRAFVFNRFDDDNVRAALKPTRDALKDMRLVDDDRPTAGHVFVYEQTISRGKDARRGVEIVVEEVAAVNA